MKKSYIIMALIVVIVSNIIIKNADSIGKWIVDTGFKALTSWIS